MPFSHFQKKDNKPFCPHHLFSVHNFLPSTDSKVLIAIGPEGDFDGAEIEGAQAAGFQSVHLGDSRLRTETAGLVALHTLVLAFNRQA